MSGGEGDSPALPAPDAAPGPARVGHGFLEGVAGVRLFYRTWEVPGPRAQVLVVHGLGEHAGRYGRVSAALVRAGFSVCSPDLRGHGRSRGRRGHVLAFDRLLRDVDRLRRRAFRAGTGAVPVFLLGHSLGGLVVLRYLQEFSPPSVAGGVCAAPFLRLAAPVPDWKLRVGRLADRFAPGLTMDNELDRELLLRDPEERQAHRVDPLVHRRISARLWGEMLRASETVERRLARLRHPVLLQIPGADRVADPEAAESVLCRDEATVDVIRYPEAYHDLYHDPAGDRALDDLASWLDRRAGGGAGRRGG